MYSLPLSLPSRSSFAAGSGLQLESWTQASPKDYFVHLQVLAQSRGGLLILLGLRGVSYQSVNVTPGGENIA